jgi:RNA-binding protein
MPLSGKQRHHLRALAHHLDPVVQLGHEGLTEGVTAQVEAALKAHELIKVRLGTECPDEREDVAAALAEATKCEVAQTIGRVIVLYRRRPKKPKVELPTRSGGERKGKTPGSKGRKPHRKKNTPRRTERLRAAARRERGAAGRGAERSAPRGGSARVGERTGPGGDRRRSGGGRAGGSGRVGGDEE